MRSTTITAQRKRNSYCQKFCACAVFIIILSHPHSIPLNASSFSPPQIYHFFCQHIRTDIYWRNFPHPRSIINPHHIHAMAVNIHLIRLYLIFDCSRSCSHLLALPLARSITYSLAFLFLLFFFFFGLFSVYQVRFISNPILFFDFINFFVCFVCDFGLMLLLLLLRSAFCDFLFDSADTHTHTYTNSPNGFDLVCLNRIRKALICVSVHLFRKTNEFTSIDLILSIALCETST